MLSYKIKEEIYASQNTLIYRGVCEDNGKTVAIKTVNTEHPTNQDLARLRHEYETGKIVRSPGVVSYENLVEWGPGLALIMEDFGAISLKQYMQENPPGVRNFLAIAVQLADALSDIHKNNVIHKDIKPSNILISTHTNAVKITDFGIASQLSREENEIVAPEQLEGTLNYMSPEQTGRMNRAVDYRSDFYALGMTFYEMLTGKLPFSSKDPIELVHSHIAREPLPPHKMNPSVPEMLSRIIMKMIAKTAEKRYQSGFGLRYDLDACLESLQSSGTIEDFRPGAKDISDRFQIPHKIYGREIEIQKLSQTYERIRNGQSEILLISGSSGSGKSALACELQRPVAESRGYYISGKFEQIHRDIPYSAIVQALGSLAHQIMGEGAKNIMRWKQKLSMVLYPNGKVICDLVEDLKLILGPQEPVPPLGLTETQHRLHYVFKIFIGCVASSDHPLVIFLDNLHHADEASLKLIETLLIDNESEHLLIIGAFRDENDILIMTNTLERIKNSGVRAEQLHLKDLDLESLCRLLSNVFHEKSEGDYEGRIRELAEVVLKKTNGNPFFVSEFLKSLYEEGGINFDYEKGRWSWDTKKIAAREITDNVIEFMTGKLLKLPAETRTLLKKAACLGAHFNLQSLSLLDEREAAYIAAALIPAMRDELITPLDDKYKYAGNTSSHIRYSFLHDRIRQAAYKLLDEEESARLHLRIGKGLLENMAENDIMTVVDHMNLALKALPHADRRILAELNLKAGQKAKSASAHQAALHYLASGLKLLPEDSWDNEYESTLSLHLETAEAAYKSADFERMENVINTVVSRARTANDRIRVYSIRIQLHTSKGQFERAVDTARDILRELGLNFPKNPDRKRLIMEVILMQIRLRLTPPEKAAELPFMSDPRIIAATTILMRTGPATYIGEPKMVPILVSTLLRHTLKYGVSSAAPFALAASGFILCASAGKVELGYRCGRQALQLLDQVELQEHKTKTLFLYYSYINHWKRPLRESPEHLLSAFQSGLETGDIDYATYSLGVNYYTSIFSGENILEIDKRLDKYLPKIQILKQEQYRPVFAIYGQLLDDLCNLKEEEKPLSGSLFDMDASLQGLIASGNGTAVFYAFISKALISYLLHDYKEAVASSSLAESYERSSIGSAVIPVLNFIQSLSLLATFHDSDRKGRRAILKKVKKNQKRMRHWAASAPMNYRHKYLLVEAESLYARGRFEKAAQLYEAVIQLARKNRFIHEEAIANELAGRSHLEHGNTDIAGYYLGKARALYGNWGAQTVVKHLQGKYSELFRRTDIVNRTGLNMNQTLTGSNRTDELDLNTILKASHTISGEIQMDKLLARMMDILMENAGAQNASFILQRGEDLYLEGQRTAGQVGEEPNFEKIRIVSDEHVPLSILQYVIRTGENLMIVDSMEDERFSRSEYVQEKKPRSVLCTPITNHGVLLGFLYMENNSSPGAFTYDRLEILNLLAAQAAISLENALLYANMEEKVRERTNSLNEKTNELQKMNGYLRETLNRAETLKNQQDGDYFLTSLLLKPLNTNRVDEGNVSVEFFLEQKFKFRGRQYEIGGDINIAHTITLSGRKYTVFLNGDAMGKSTQGAGGVLVLGTAFEVIMDRTRTSSEVGRMTPGIWLRQAFHELHKVFVVFSGSMLVSVVFGIVDDETGQLRFINAEHPFLTLYRDGKASFIDEEHIYRKLGTEIQENLGNDMRINEFQLMKGDTIISGSDGRDDVLLRMENKRRVINEDEQLFLKHVERERGRLPGIVRSIRSTGELTDDISLLKLSFG